MCIRVVGEAQILCTTARDLEVRLCAARDVGAGRLLLDLSETTFMDPTGLRTLLRWHEECRRRGMDARIVAVSQAVGRLFEVTEVTALLDPRAGA